MGNHGGRREGAGRKPNAIAYESEIQTLTDAIAANVQEIFDKGMELVQGVEAMKVVRGKEIVYSIPPNAKMIIFFLERLAGKPTQPVELGNGDDGPLKIQVVYADADAPGDIAEAPPGAGEDPPGDEAI